MPPTELLFPLSRASSRLRPDEDRRPAGGHRVRCRQRRRSLSPAEWLAISALPLLAALWAGVAHGQSLTVMATVDGACSAQSGTLNFGQYVTGQSSSKAAVTTFNVTCPSGVSVSIKLSPGNNDDGTDRGMTRTGSNDVLKYNLFTASDFTQVWGDGTFGQAKTISPFDPLGHAAQQVHGRVNANQTVSPGEYSDTVAITVDLMPQS